MLVPRLGKQVQSQDRSIVRNLPYGCVIKGGRLIAEHEFFWETKRHLWYQIALTINKANGI